MINRFVDKLSALAAIFRHHSEEQKQVIGESKPEQNEYEKLWKRTQELAKFTPVYLESKDFIYQVIDELTYVAVPIKTGKSGVLLVSTPTRHTLFDAIVNRTLEQQGYTEITAREFHHDFTVIQNEINMKVNKAIQASL